jgi:hypothetical protein
MHTKDYILKFKGPQKLRYIPKLLVDLLPYNWPKTGTYDVGNLPKDFPTS